MKKYTFHMIGMTHVPVSKRYMACAYTQKVVKLAKMLKDLGHTVYVYGTEGSDCEATEVINVCDLDMIRDTYGDGDNRFELGYDWHNGFFRHNFDAPYKEATKIFFLNSIAEIAKRKKPDDFLLLSMGLQHKPIADGVGLFLTAESGVGYRGSYAKYKCFESSYLMNFTYGKNSGGKDINGNNYDVVIPNYFEPEDFEFKKEKQDYFLYLGRLIQRKGILTAHEVCRILGKTLKIAGQGALSWDEKTKTLVTSEFTISGNIEYVGFADKEKRSELMSNAKATFVATDYLEPFGGVSIESLLCGTPVITTNFGAFPETIPHGVVGYRCQTLDQFVWAARNIDKIDTQTCRDFAVRNYSTEKVGKMYMEWFDSLYHLYLSLEHKNEGWHYINPDRKDLDWLNKF